MTLKTNSKKVLDIIAGQTKRNATQAYKQVYPDASVATAQVNSAQLMAKPEATIYLQEHINQAAETVVDVMRNARAQTDSPAFQRLAKDSAESILNRELGTPTQTIKQTTQGVTLVIDLTSALQAQDA